MSLDVSKVSKHKTQHQDTGADEISVVALSGELADRQPSKTGTSILGWTNLKLLKGAGAGADPTEIDVPSGGVTTFAALTDVKLVRKTADQAVNNSTVLVNDTHLLFAIAANEVWKIDVYILHMAANATPAYKFGWAYPVDCSIKWGPEIFINITPVVFAIWSSSIGDLQYKFRKIETDTIADYVAPNAVHHLHFIALIANGGNAGTINLQWAQNTAHASDSKVLTNSCIIAHKLA